MITTIKRNYLTFAFAFFCIVILVSHPLKAQLTTSTSLTPNQLVQNILLGGGLTATNVTYNGDPAAIGTFNGASSNIGFTSGVIMATGDISNAIGPNNSGSTGSNFGGSSSDPELSAIAGGSSLNDAAILEFDFVPSSDTIKFRYVFGSEEYMEYAGSGYNDAFGFFISGPNPAGGTFTNKNIALIPNTTTPVTINNVNLNSNGTYYFDNGNGSGSGTASDGQTVQYDGFTKPMFAVSPVICGQQYHIKLAITDVGDGAYDSGVFLEEGSFSGSGGSELFSIANNFGGVTQGNDTTLYEGCSFASLVVERSNSSIAQTFPCVITGTAANGTDFTVSATNFTFPAGQDTASIIITTIADVVPEGTETVTVTVYATAACGGGNDTLTKTIYIVDSPPLTVSLNNDTSFICPPQNFYLTAHVTGGASAGGYNYHWQNFPTHTHDTMHIYPLTTTTYIVNVTDNCGHSGFDTMTINLSAYTPMTLTMSDDTAMCGGESTFIQAQVTDGIPPYTYNWNPNVTTQNMITVTPSSTTPYILTVVDGCNVAIKDTTNVTIYPVDAAFSYTMISNQTLRFSNLSIGGAQYYWTFYDGTPDSVSTEINPEHSFPVDDDSTYSYYLVRLVVVNPLGCTDTTYATIRVVPDFTFYFPNTFTPNDNGLNEIFTGYGAGIKTYKMRIFDRWGRLMYESTDMLQGWDGTYKGNMVELGVYVCMFELSDYNDKRVKRFGNVNLVR